MQITTLENTEIMSTQNQKKQIILNCEQLETRFALLKGGKLEEYEIERPDEDEIIPGSIYLGKIVRLEPNLEAAFVNIGAEKNAFMHYKDMLPASYDIMDNIRKIDEKNKKADKEMPEEKKGGKGKGSPKNKKLMSIFSEKVRGFLGRADKSRRLKEFEERLHGGKITTADIPKVFPYNSELLVQVTKGPIGIKGARATTNISIPGRYLVLLPYSDHIGLSSKIDDAKERSRLRKILGELDVPDGMGLICRTVGEGRKAVFFRRDLDMLLNIWHDIETALENNSSAPKLLYEEPKLLERTVRDLLTDEIDEIIVDDKEKYQYLKESLSRFVGKDFNTKITMYQRAEPVFVKYKVAEQVADIFKRVVSLPSGGYICIDETEALISIDVNSGKSKSAKDQPQMILQTNLEAAEEIARQMRLRNIGGLLVIDFIDMNSAKDRETVNKAVRKFVQDDRAKIKLLPISKFGLMEMTRQRENESLKDVVYDLCPYCNGSGRVKSAISMSVEIQRRLKEILKRRRREKSFAVRVIMNPAVLARLKNDDATLLKELEAEYGKDLSFRADPSIHIEDFKLINPDTNQPL